MVKTFLKSAGYGILASIFVLGIFLVGISTKISLPACFAGEEIFQIAKAKEKKKEPKKKKGQAPATQDEDVNQLSPTRSSKVISHRFKVPPTLQDAVDFWKMVYTKYDRNFEIFHDTENLNVIYSVLDFTDLYNNLELTREDRLVLFQPRMDAEEARIKDLLLSIHAKKDQPDSLSKEERRVYDLFKAAANPDKFLEAADEARIRAQTGIKNKFLEAIRISGAYLEEMENIFMDNGLPIELTRMAFVESMFDIRAQSKVGASGVWQFMPGTGRIFGLNVNAIIDERNDPIIATHAAARLLKSNYEALGTWPLAINAYNSGRATMSRAVAVMGTDDIATIINNYRGGVYGFASRNFYPSFLAALEVANHYPKYFGEITRDRKFEYDTYYVRNSVLMGDLAGAAQVDWVVLAEINPHYSEEVKNNVKKIPAGYAIRIPKGTEPKFTQAEVLMAERQNKPGTDLDQNP